MQSLESVALSFLALAHLSLHTVAYAFNALHAMLLAMILPENALYNRICPPCAM